MNRIREFFELDKIKQTGRNIRIAILDTGIFLHRDIENSVIFFKDFNVILYNLYINGLDFIKNTNIKKSDFKKWFFEVVTKMSDEDLRLLQNDYYNNITKI